MASPFPDPPARPPTYTYQPPTQPLRPALAPPALLPYAAEPARPAASPPPSENAEPARRAPVRVGLLVLILALCLLSGVAGGIFVRATQPTRPAVVAGAGAAPPQATIAPTSSADPAALPAPGTVAHVAQQAKPSVVTIEASTGSGSGVIVASDGTIITNAHVVDNASTVTVRFADGAETSGRVLGADPDTDVAVVKVDRTDLPAARLGSALTLHPGDPVVAVGNPLGLEGSVSAGVVSALGRYVPEETGGLRAAIQTDAAVNPGNSGGALLDGSGAVVGITAAKAGGQSVDSIGFAIPIDIAKAIADDLAARRTPSHPYLGVTGPEVDPATARALGSPVGARLDSVSSGTPAARAGLKADDVIVTMDGTTIGSFFDLGVFLGTHRAGDVVTLGLADGRSLDVTLGERP